MLQTALLGITEFIFINKEKLLIFGISKTEVGNVRWEKFIGREMRRWPKMERNEEIAQIHKKQS